MGRSGEFLLSTAYVFRDDISLLNRLIPELRSKNVCGMGVKTQRYIEDVPESVLKVADDLGFPIIRIPSEVPYGDLIKEIFNHIIGQQRDLLIRINDFNKTVREIMLKRGGMQEIAEQISSSLNLRLSSTMIFSVIPMFIADEETKI